MALLRIANLQKTYNITKTQQQHVLKGVDVEFKSGDLVALLGESGCGKSTLINILGGLDTDYTGSVVIKGDFLRDYTEKQMDDYRKKRVGLIFQNYNLIPHLSIKENIKIAMDMSDISAEQCESRAKDLLRLMGLADYEGKLPNQLSGGQKQRVAIARALANNPTVLLADEPTGALDAESADVIMQILKKIAETGKLVIIVTHSQRVAEQCCRIIRMEDGVIASDTQTNKLHIDTKRDKEIVPKSIKTKKILSLAMNNVKQKKSRSALVAVGMAISMAVVLLILCLSAGLTAYVENVYAEKAQSLHAIVTKNENADFSEEDTEAIDALTSMQTVIHTLALTDVSFRAQGISEGTLGQVYPYYEGQFEPELLHGKIEADTEEASYILVNETLANALAENGIITAMGDTVRITASNATTLTFTVSGIYKDQFGEEEGYNVFLSEASIRAITGEQTRVNTVYAVAKGTAYVSAMKSDLQSLGFTVYQADSSVESVMEYIDLGTKILTAVGMVALVVSAIMIFIVLYISVNERMKEIGILRAIGARKQDVRKMFLFEAGFLGIIAGVLSVAGCFVISLITNIICASTLQYALISYHPGYYLLGIVASACISMLAGISPAMRAADLDPVEALRAE